VIQVKFRCQTQAKTHGVTSALTRVSLPNTHSRAEADSSRVQMNRLINRLNSSKARARDAIVLLSGGLDSATVLALAREEGYRVRALSFDYGQRHRHEISCAKAVAESLGAYSHDLVCVDLRAIGGSALTDDTMVVPKNRHNTPADIPVTYVPARNTIFLSYGLALAETVGAKDIFIGANAVDYSGYPDCRPEYFAAFQNMASLATRAAVEDPGAAAVIRTPLLHLTKTQIIEKGLALGVDFAMTSSCYDPEPNSGRPCEACDSCLIRAKAFSALGYDVDPAVARHR
jgi:7-cyano-7-deazaguanine synthase